MYVYRLVAAYISNSVSTLIYDHVLTKGLMYVILNTCEEKLDTSKFITLKDKLLVNR